MTTVERIREVCKNKGIPISKLERDCGFSNGYINSLKKGTVPEHKLSKIAERLEVSKEYLLTGENENELRNRELMRLRNAIEQLEYVMKDASVDTIRRLTYYAEGLMAAERDRQHETSK